MPPSASSKRPMRFSAAPVNAPFSWPNSSLSTRPAGRAEQLSLISGLSFRRERLWTARAISSFPVPVSPRISTVESVGATCFTLASTLRSTAEPPMISSKLYSLLISSCR